jgi:hypothetical protein
MTKIILIVVVILFSAGEVLAKQVQFQGTQSQVVKACKQVGGELSVGAHSASCLNKDCDGKGGNCTVTCDDQNQCTGDTPDRVTRHKSSNIRGILSGKLSARSR